MDPFNEFDRLSFKIIEILGTSFEIKKHCIGWLISAKKKYKIIKRIIEFFYFKTISRNKKVASSLVVDRNFLISQTF